MLTECLPSPSWIKHFSVYLLFVIFALIWWMFVCVFVWSYPHGNGFQYTPQNIHGRILHKNASLLYHRDCGLFLFYVSVVALFFFGSKNCVYFRGLSFPCCHVIVCCFYFFYFFFVFQRVVKLFIFSFSTNIHTHMYTQTYICIY